LKIFALVASEGVRTDRKHAVVSMELSEFLQQLRPRRVNDVIVMDIEMFVKNPG
jgi:hypothetical protein